MAILNENTGLTDQERRSFKGEPQKKLYPAGTRFYRIGTEERQELFHDGNNTVGSSSWIPEDEYKKILHDAAGSNTSLGDVARRRLAVQREWNPALDNVTEIRLTKPVYGWEGVAGSQPFSGPDNAANPNAKFRLRGGGRQVVIPGLGIEDPKSAKPYPHSDHAEILSYQQRMNEKLGLPGNRNETPAQVNSRSREVYTKESRAAESRNESAFVDRAERKKQMAELSRSREMKGSRDRGAKEK